MPKNKNGYCVTIASLFVASALTACTVSPAHDIGMKRSGDFCMDTHALNHYQVTCSQRQEQIRFLNNMHRACYFSPRDKWIISQHLMELGWCP